MKKSKILSVLLSLTMICALLSGCVYMDLDADIHDNGSGTVTFAAGFLATEGEEPEEGDQIFEKNGNKYYGKSETYEFASVEEFNALFSSESSDDEESEEIGSSGLVSSLKKNNDGSMTLVVLVGSEEEETETDDEEESQDTYAAADDSDGGMDINAAMDSVMDTAYMCYTFRFDQNIRQMSGPTEAISIDGKTLTIDLTKQESLDGLVTYVFTTDVKSTVVPSTQTLKINGEEKVTEIYNINGSNYFKLRDMAALLNGTEAQFSVDYDAENRMIVIETGKAYTAMEGDLTMPSAEKASEKANGAVKSTQSMTVDGTAVFLAPYNIGGNNYFALRDLGAALGFGVDYDDSARAMLVSTK